MVHGGKLSNWKGFYCRKEVAGNMYINLCISLVTTPFFFRKAWSRSYVCMCSIYYAIYLVPVDSGEFNSLSELVQLGGATAAAGAPRGHPGRGSCRVHYHRELVYISLAVHAALGMTGLSYVHSIQAIVRCFYNQISFRPHNSSLK